MIKTIKNELKEIKWLSAKDTIKQTFYSMGIIAIVALILMIYELSINTMISLIIK